MKNKKTTLSWIMYDFANSPFTTLIVTFIYATFFTKMIAPDEITGTALWSRGVTLTAIFVALLSPFLGAEKAAKDLTGKYGEIELIWNTAEDGDAAKQVELVQEFIQNCVD